MTNSIDVCFSYIRQSFSDCADFNSRKINYRDGKTAYLLNIGSYTDRDYISESIVLPLLKSQHSPADKNELFGMISSTELCELTNADTAIARLLSGFAVIITELGDSFGIFASQVRFVASRSVSEPDSETVIRGPREGFVENSEDNLALLRKRLKTTRFKSIRLSKGTLTKTTIDKLILNFHN